MEPEQTQEKSKMTAFELCRELNLHAFPARKRDLAMYYVQPDMLITMRDLDVLYGEDGRPYGFPIQDNEPGKSLFDQLIYRPEIEDFVEFLGSDFQTIHQTNRSGYFSYVNSSLGEGITTRSGGDTLWYSLANVVLARYLEKEQQIPTIDVSDSENVETVRERHTKYAD